MWAGLLGRKTAVAPVGAVLQAGDFVPAERIDLPADPLEQALRQERCGAIVRHRERWVNHPNFATGFDAAVRAIDERFALVPEGIVSLALSIFDEPGQPEEDVTTEPFLLARHAVTNAEFQHFVDAGGYEQLELWPEALWAQLIDLKDATGQPGPRYWKHGRHDRRLARHPVVGVCFYEGAAYAAWAGYRLPTDAEWQMAAGWRLRSAAQAQRRYPWGDGFDVNCCNLWASGHGGTLPVDAYAPGAAPNGARQLVGNTWEWTETDYYPVDRDGRQVVGSALLKGLRGGAYDSYFPWQATSTFRTGLEGLARVHNVGFRCALDLLAN